MYRVASLFSGCGGGDRGMIGGFTYNNKYYEKLPFSIIFATDIDRTALETYKANIECDNIVCRDIRKTKPDDVPEHDVLIGSFPCQPFSSLTTNKTSTADDAKLFKRMVKILRYKQPKMFITENVKGLLKMQGGTVFKKIYRSFRDCGYKISYKLLNAADYGIPQKRERVIIVGVRKDLNVKFRFPEGKYKGNWVPLSTVVPVLAIDDKRYYFSDKAVQGLKKGKSNSPNTLKKGAWQRLDEPCLTITKQLNKLNSTNPVLRVDAEKELYRRFTPREAAGIQSFPDDFKFIGSETSVYAHIGNAVPPVLFYAENHIIPIF